MAAEETRVRIVGEMLERFEKRYTEEEQAGHLMHRIHEAYGLRSAAVLAAPEKGGAVSVFAHRGLSHDFIKAMYSRKAIPLLEAAAKGEVAVREGDPRRKDPSFRLEHDYQSLFAAPCRIQGETVGFFVADSADPGLLTGEVRGQLLSVARIAAILLAFRDLKGRIPRVPEIDTVTGLRTFKHFHEVLDREVRRGEKLGHPVSLVFIKIRNLREMNNVYGHLAGDEALGQVVARVRSGLREMDYAARSGGVVYVVMPQLAKEAAAKAAERMVDAMDASPVARGEVALKLAIGVGAYPKDGVTERVLIPHVEAMVFESVRKGGNAVSVYRD